MARGDVRGDRQAHADAAGGAAARRLDAVERLHHALQFFRWDAGAIVTDIDQHALRAVGQHDAGRAAVAPRILHQVHHRAPQVGWARQQRLRLAAQRDLMAGLGGIVDHRLEQRQHIDALARAAGLVAVAQVVQRGVDQAVHLGQVLAQAVAHFAGLLAVDGVHAFDAQAHARRRRAQIVRHRGQEARLLRELVADALLHMVQRLRRGARLRRAGAFVERRRMDVLRQPAGAASELLYRSRQQPRAAPRGRHDRGHLEQQADVRRPRSPRRTGRCCRRQADRSGRYARRPKKCTRTRSRRGPRTGKFRTRCPVRRQRAAAPPRKRGQHGRDVMRRDARRLVGLVGLCIRTVGRGTAARGYFSALSQPAAALPGLPSSALSAPSRSLGLIAGVSSLGAGASSSFISPIKRDGWHE